MEKEQDYMVGYFPEVFSSKPFALGHHADLADAIEAAAGYSRMYYGQCSPIVVLHGRKKIITIPRRAAA